MIDGVTSKDSDTSSCTSRRATEAETEAESAAVVAATAAMAAGCTPFVTNERLVMNGCPDGEGFERGAAGSSVGNAPASSLLLDSAVSFAV